MRPIALIIVIPLLLLSCNIFKKENIQKVDEAAVVSIYVNNRIDVQTFSELEGVASHLSKRKNFQLDTIANLLRQKTLSNFSSRLPFPLRDEERMLSYLPYQNVNLPSFNQFVPSKPKGYKEIPTYNKEMAMTMFDVLPEEIKAIMLVGMDYRLVREGKLMTYVNSRVQSRLTIRIWNQKGDSLLNVRQTALSENTLSFSLGGGFQAHELRPLCIDASQKAIGKMEGYLDQNL